MNLNALEHLSSMSRTKISSHASSNGANVIYAGPLKETRQPLLLEKVTHLSMTFLPLPSNSRPKKQLLLGENYARYAAASDVTQGPTFPDVRAVG